VIFSLLLPPILLMLVIVQITVLDLLTFGWIGPEVSLAVVIFSGFHHGLLKGGAVALLLGFFLDCLTSPIFGLYTFLYLAVLLLARIAAGQVYRENLALVAAFTVLCQLLEGLAIVLIYHWALGADILPAMARIFLPQAALTGLASPFVFLFLKQLEALMHAKDPQPARWLRSG